MLAIAFFLAVLLAIAALILFLSLRLGSAPRMEVFQFVLFDKEFSLARIPQNTSNSGPWIWDVEGRTLLSEVLKNVSAAIFSAIAAVLSIELIRDFINTAKDLRSAGMLIRSDPNRNNNEQIEMFTGRGWNSNCRLFRSNFTGGNFQNQNLQNAKLPFCRLKSANFEGADLRLADLRGSDLTDASLNNALVNKCDLRGCTLERVDKEKLKRSGAILDGA